MGLFDKLKEAVNDRENNLVDKDELSGADADTLSKRETAIAEKEKSLDARFKKSREYRIMLQEYSRQLGQRSADLDAREEKLVAEEKDSMSRILTAKDDLENYRMALLNTEYRIMDYVKRIEQKELALLEEFQNDIEMAKAFNDSHRSDGFAFETQVADLMRLNGYEQVTVTSKSNDFGADILAQRDGVKYVIQCKYYSSPVGIEAVQQVYAAKVYYGAHVSVVVTNNVFTNAAKILAKESGVLLWDFQKLNELETKANKTQSAEAEKI